MAIALRFIIFFRTSWDEAPALLPLSERTQLANPFGQTTLSLCSGAPSKKLAVVNSCQGFGGPRRSRQAFQLPPRPPRPNVARYRLRELVDWLTSWVELEDDLECGIHHSASNLGAHSVAVI
jgi:hypothetical protein